MSTQGQTPTELDKVRDRAVALGASRREPARFRFSSSPMLRALILAGTAHVYADTADSHELGELLEVTDSEIYREVDGNTANQPLVRKVIERYLPGHEAQRWRDLFENGGSNLDVVMQTILLYTVICGRIGNDILRAFAGGRQWEISLQLHMRLVGQREEAMRIARILREIVPTAIVKVPFAPHWPDSLLLARDLEREGIPVNFTSTFSARQALAAALLCNVARTNIFMGRLNQGMHARLLGEHTSLEAQRAIARERHESGIRTLLIIASLREWETLTRTAGCDIYTAPCNLIQDFISKADVGPEEIKSRLTASYEEKLGIDSDVRSAVGAERIARLYRIEDEFLEFLRELRKGGQFDRIENGDELYRHFDRAGFADFFHSPGDAEWDEIRRSKLPDLHGSLVKNLALDTLYSLLADADFQNYQDQMDSLIQRNLAS